MKIDTTSIEGFEGMTAEQKVTALLGLDVPDPVDLSGYVKKDVFDAKATEAANLSKQLRGRMSEDEAAKAQEAADRKEMEEKYNALLKKSTIADHTANFLALGYDKELAKATAEALFDGDMEKVFENQKKFNEDREKKLRAELVKQDPRPDGGGGANGGEQDANVEYARNLGKKRAASMQASSDVLNKYKIGK